MSLFSQYREPYSMNTFDSRLFGYRVQTSLYGGPIPLLYGTQRVVGNVIWFGNFTATPTSGGKKSGKKGSQQQFDYKSSLIIALCQGVVQGIGYIWVNQIRYVVNSAAQNVTIPGGGGPVVVTNAANYLASVGVGFAKNYSVVANNYGSPGSVTLSGATQKPLEQVPSSPVSGQFSVNPATGTYQFAAADAGQSATIVYTFADPNSSWDGNPTGTLGFTLFEGDQGQAPWGTLPAGQALGYSELAYLANPLLDMGTSGNIDNFSFEVIGPFTFGAGIQDAEISACIPDFLSDSLHGAGFPSNLLGDMGLVVGPQGSGGQVGGSGLEYYCGANGIFISQLLSQQRTAASVLQDWLTIANCEAVWSEGILKFYCYGDKTVVGNNVVYVPNTTPVYDLDDDDFLSDEGEAPVEVDRPNVRDCYNAIKVEWTNRGNDYQSETVEEMDLWHIDLYGYRPAEVLKLDAITTQTVAAQVANVALKNLVYKRNTYKFKISAVKYQLLEPMDLVTITDLYLGLNKVPVRITSITEDDDLQYEIEAEEFPWGTATPTLYAKQTVGPFGPGYFAPPGSVYQPVFFEATREMTQNVGYQLRMGLTGGNQWGGCNVFVSTDNGVTYQPIGRQQSSTRMGVLTAPLPYAFDPDTTNTLSVNITESNGQTLDSFTKAQADAFVSLFLVDDELMSYENSSLASQNVYDLTYLRRGVYDSAQSAHQTDAQFTMLDSTAFTYEYDSTLIGKTLYFKFTSFNLSNNAEEDISNVAAYPYYIKGPRPPFPPMQFNFPYNYPGGFPTALIQYASFGMQQNSKTGGAAQLTLVASLPINTPSTDTQAPQFEITSIPSTGGNFFGGQLLQVGAYALDLSGNLSLLNVRSVQIPVGTNTNQIVGTYTTTNVTDNIIFVVSGNIDAGFTTSSFSASGGAFSITNIIPGPAYAPLICDPAIDHLVVNVYQGRNSGVWGGIAVSAVYNSGPANSTITVASQFGQPATFTPNALVGRYLSMLANGEPSATYDSANRYTPLLDLQVISNTATTITVYGDVTSLVGGFAFVEPNDVIFVRLMGDNSLCSATTIGDILWGTLNPLTVDAEIGNIVQIIAGTGAGQKAFITSNTINQVTVFPEFAIVPDNTSVFILYSGTTTLTVAGLPFTQTGSTWPQYSTIPIPLPNTPATYWILELLSCGSEGELSTAEFSPYREVWLNASGLPIAAIDFSLSPYVLAQSDVVLNVDTSGGNVVIQLPPAATLSGQSFIIYKTTYDTNTVTINAAPGETFSGGVASIVLTLGGQSWEVISNG